MFINLLFAAEKISQTTTQTVLAGGTNYFVWTVIASCIGLAIAAALCGIAQSNAVAKSVEGIARQPEATSQIQTAMILGLAFIESLVIYVLLIALILLFVNPFAKYFIQ